MLLRAEKSRLLLQTRLRHRRFSRFSTAARCPIDRAVNVAKRTLAIKATGNPDGGGRKIRRRRRGDVFPRVLFLALKSTKDLAAGVTALLPPRPRREFNFSFPSPPFPSPSLFTWHCIREDVTEFAGSPAFRLLALAVSPTSVQSSSRGRCKFIRRFARTRRRGNIRLSIASIRPSPVLSRLASFLPRSRCCIL